MNPDVWIDGDWRNQNGSPNGLDLNWERWHYNHYNKGKQSDIHIITSHLVEVLSKTSTQVQYKISTHEPPTDWSCKTH